MLAMVLVVLSLGMDDAREQKVTPIEGGPVEIVEHSPEPILALETVKLTADGVSEEYSVELGTVSNLLTIAEIELGEHDVVRPSADAELEGGMEIVVLRATERTVSYTVAIPYEIEWIPNEYIPKGTQIVHQEGVAGRERITYTVTDVGGVRVARTASVSETLQEPVKKIVEYGPGGTIVTDDGREIEWSYKIDGQATAYTTEGYRNKRNATGHIAREGTIAVDPRVIPLGTKVYVEGNGWVYGEATAEDTGGAIKGNIIDVFFNTRAQCYRFGRRSCTIYVIGK